MHVLTYLHVYINRAYISTSVHKSCFWKMGSCAALTLSLRSIERLSLDRQRLKVAISKKRNEKHCTIPSIPAYVNLQFPAKILLGPKSIAVNYNSN